MRELENTIESLVALSFEGEVDMSLIPTSAQTRPTPPLGLKERVEAYERGLIVEALRNADGNHSEAARQLQVPRVTLHDKLRKYQLSAGGQEEGGE